MRRDPKARFVSLIGAVVVALGLLTTAASPAHAQLGRLKKIAEDAAKKSAGVEKPTAPAKATADEVKESGDITAERIDAVIAFLTPLVADAERVSALRVATSAYERDMKEASDCLSAFTKSGAMPSGDKAEEMNKFEKRQSALNKLATQALDAGDYRRGMAYQDSAGVTQARMMVAMFNATKCKQVPYRPAIVIEDEARKLADATAGKTQPEEGAAKIDVPASNRAGMSTRMFGLTRERIALYGLLATKAITTAQAGKEGVFTDAETAALNARKAQILKMEPLFKTSALEYKGWSDLTYW